MFAGFATSKTLAIVPPLALPARQNGPLRTTTSHPRTHARTLHGVAAFNCDCLLTQGLARVVHDLQPHSGSDGQHLYCSQQPILSTLNRRTMKLPRSDGMLSKPDMDTKMTPAHQRNTQCEMREQSITRARWHTLAFRFSAIFRNHVRHPRRLARDVRIVRLITNASSHKDLAVLAEGPHS